MKTTIKSIVLPLLLVLYCIKRVAFYALASHSKDDKKYKVPITIEIKIIKSIFAEIHLQSLQTFHNPYISLRVKRYKIGTKLTKLVILFRLDTFLPPNIFLLQNR